MRILLAALSLAFAGSAYADTKAPDRFLTDMIAVFNTGDAEGHVSHFAVPHVRIINGNTVVQTDNSPFVDFDQMRQNGWAYSRIDATEIIAESDDSAMVLMDFSRMNAADEPMASMSVVYTLAKQGDSWKVAGFSAVVPTAPIED